MNDLNNAPMFPFNRDARCPFDPPPELAALREDEPISKVSIWSGAKPWLVTRYRDYKTLLLDPNFSVDSSRPGYPAVSPGSKALGARFLVGIDPPDHDILRRKVAYHFAVKQVETLRPEIRTIVDGLLDRMVELGPPAEFVSDFALKVPTNVICAILGIPVADQDLIYNLVSQLLNLDTPAEAARAATQSLYDYIFDLAREKQSNRTNDLISELSREVDSQGLEEQQLADLVANLITGGFETTGSTIALGTVVLLQHPSQCRDLIENPDLVTNAVEEILRYTSVTHAGRRRCATADVDISGYCIQKGDGVIAADNSANRDPEIFELPDVFDIHRPKARQHVAFGFGLHSCIGGPLVRVELQVVFEHCLPGYPSLELAVPVADLAFKDRSQTYGVASCPVTW